LSFSSNHKIHVEALAFFFVTALTEPELIEAVSTVALSNQLALSSL
jgi:hypothetical protein